MTNKLEIEIGEESDYQGSKVFASLADAIGLSVDLVSLILPLYSRNFSKHWRVKKLRKFRTQIITPT